MQLGSNSKQGVIVGEYGSDRDGKSDKNDVIGWAEPACENPSWIIWFTRQGDALLYTEREPGGAVVGEPIRAKAQKK